MNKLKELRDRMREYGYIGWVNQIDTIITESEQSLSGGVLEALEGLESNIIEYFKEIGAWPDTCCHQDDLLQDIRRCITIVKRHTGKVLVSFKCPMAEDGSFIIDPEEWIDILKTIEDTGYLDGDKSVRVTISEVENEN